MKLAVYRYAEDGKIRNIQRLTRTGKDISDSEIEKAVKEFNDNSDNDGVEVEAVELKEDSLELFLYEERMSEITDFKNEILSIEDYLLDVENSCERLVDLMKKWTKFQEV